MNELERFRETLRKLCLEVENLTIENMVYFNAIIENTNLNLPSLKKLVAEAQADPEKRKEAHQMYAEMWKAVEDTGTDAVVEDLLKDLPPSGKPN